MRAKKENGRAQGAFPARKLPTGLLRSIRRPLWSTLGGVDIVLGRRWSTLGRTQSCAHCCSLACYLCTMACGSPPGGAQKGTPVADFYYTMFKESN